MVEFSFVAEGSRRDITSRMRTGARPCAPLLAVGCGWWLVEVCGEIFVLRCDLEDFFAFVKALVVVDLLW